MKARAKPADTSGVRVRKAAPEGSSREGRTPPIPVCLTATTSPPIKPNDPNTVQPTPRPGVSVTNLDAGAAVNFDAVPTSRYGEWSWWCQRGVTAPSLTCNSRASPRRPILSPATSLAPRQPWSSSDAFYCLACHWSSTRCARSLHSAATRPPAARRRRRRDLYQA